MNMTYTVEIMQERKLGRLRIMGELEWECRPDFIQAMNELAATGQDKLVVDLSGISRMASVFIGTLVDHGVKLTNSGKSLSVMLPAKLAKVVAGAGLDKVVTIIPVG